LKILVIDDNPTNMKLVSDILKKSGYEVLQAVDAESGIALAKEETPPVVLMDIQLPGMDGLEATRLLKADETTGHIKIIAITAFAMKGDRERILSAGCDDYIAKPVGYKELLEKVYRMRKQNKGEN